jgi:hypothetical protein
MITVALLLHTKRKYIIKMENTLIISRIKLSNYNGNIRLK